MSYSVNNFPMTSRLYSLLYYECFCSVTLPYLSVIVMVSNGAFGTTSPNSSLERRNDVKLLSFNFNNEMLIFFSLTTVILTGG